jgi:ABC-2 type transport system ATP-binding protein
MDSASLNNQSADKPTLVVSGLRKVFGNTIAVDGISFELRQNEILGLLGPNGAGKTTTINMILGVLKPTTGEISVDGMSISRNRSKILERTNFSAVYAPLPGNLTVAQNLRVFGLLYGIPHISERIEELLITFDLAKFRNTKCGILSSGEQTRVGLAKAFINDPTLLLLDEPTASLDPSKALEIRTLIREFAHKKSVAILLTSHNMYEVEHICDGVLFLSKGKILLEGDPKSLPAEHGKATLEDLFITVAREPLSLERSVGA